MLEWLQSTFAALSLRHFRILWIGTVCSHLAFFMSTVVQSVVAFDLVGNNTAVGTVVFAQGVSMFLLAPLGGALADRWPKRLVVGASQTIPATVFLLLAAAYAAGAIRIELVAGGSFMIGVTFAFLGPARNSLVAELVPADSRGNAVALTQVASTMSQVGGPALAGVLLVWSLSGAAGAYATMGGLYVVSTALLLFLPPSRMRSDAADTHVLADVAAGLRYVFGRPRLRAMVLLYISVIMLGFPYVALMPGLVVNAFGREPEATAPLFFLSACGALISSLAVARYADHHRATALYASLGLLFGLALMTLSRVPSFEAASFAMLGVGAGFGGFMTLNGAVIVRSTDPEFFGRIMSLTMLAFASFGLMGLPIGVLADAVGERTTLLVQGAAVCAAVAGFAAFSARVHADSAAGTG